MPLYVVVHHQRDENQPWINAWLNDQLIEAIQTTKEIGKHCREAKQHSERVFVHRCGWGEMPPVICCSAEVESVAEIDRASVLVRFTNVMAANDFPPKSPIKGQNFYIT
ncbi:MAG: hypothetical protein P4N60_21465 [Verrucomicrobiae bacterium]|nr:hypothetical protein [Verrucomicrobiae bacterium]